MSKSTKILAVGKENLSREEAATKIRLLADKIESGEVSFTDNANTTATIPQSVELEIEYSEKVKKTGVKKFEIEIELEWKSGENSIPL